MSLPHDVSFNNKGKLIWTESLQELQRRIEKTHVTLTLNTNDLRDINDVNRQVVDKIQCEKATPDVIKKIPANSSSIQDDQMLSLKPSKAKYKLLLKK